MTRRKQNMFQLAAAQMVAGLDVEQLRTKAAQSYL
jgi:hypothetical protein